MNQTGYSMFLTDSLNTAFNNSTDWQDIFVQNSTLYNIDASISGAFGTNQYRVSLGYYNEEGVRITSYNVCYTKLLRLIARTNNENYYYYDRIKECFYPYPVLTVLGPTSIV